MHLAQNCHKRGLQNIEGFTLDTTLTWPEEEGDMKVEIMSTGTGNTIVELFSAEMLVRVCR